MPILLLQIGQDLALCISTQAEKRAQEIYHWCREDGLEGSSLSLEGMMEYDQIDTCGKKCFMVLKPSTISGPTVSPCSSHVQLSFARIGSFLGSSHLVPCTESHCFPFFNNPERNSCCLEYIKSKHDSSQQAHCTIRQLENDLHEDLKKCHGLRMEIFNILKSIIDFATVDSVEHDKVVLSACPHVMYMWPGMPLRCPKACLTYMHDLENAVVFYLTL